MAKGIKSTKTRGLILVALGLSISIFGYLYNGVGAIGFLGFGSVLLGGGLVVLFTSKN